MTKRWFFSGSHLGGRVEAHALALMLVEAVSALRRYVAREVALPRGKRWRHYGS